MKKCIIFDFDGTLADTMPDHYLAWKKALSIHNCVIKKNDYFKLEGESLYNIASFFLNQLNLTKEQINETITLKKEIYIKKQKKIKYYEGVYDLIEELSYLKVPLSIVSASHMDQIKSKVSKSFLNNFNIVISGDMNKNNKPHPEPYLKALTLLNIRSLDALVIENAPLGVLSAKAANIYCIAICSTNKKNILKNADDVIDNFYDLNWHNKIIEIKELYKKYI